MSLNNTLSHEIADVLRDEILRGQFRSGERLPSERDLAARFDASRGAVREGLSQLELLGLIRILPGGARVQPIGSASIAVLGPLMALGELPDQALVDQFLQTFGALTSLTARSAVDKASNEQLIQLKQMLVELTKQSDDFEAIQPKWREFLEFLADISDNLVIRLIGNDLKAQFVEQMMKIGIKPEINKRAMLQLLNSLKSSLANRDADLAASAMEAHFIDVRLAIADAFETRIASYQKEAV